MKARWIGTFMVLAIGIGTGACLHGTLPPAASTSAAPMSMEDSFADVAEKATKAVVHITTKSLVYPDLPIRLEQEGIGSGAVVTKQGHILTNFHVVKGGRDFKVLFVDGSIYTGTLVGTDPDTDLAVLKIDLPKDSTIEPISIADSDKIRVGDWVLAIGSPFGYSHTVTAGIISARHRRARQDIPYQDFIQTDAAINPGNSGGALVNRKGELVGVNSMIVSGGQGSDGIGFAIASNLAKFVYERLVKDGRVKRGFLGIGLQDIDEDLAAKLGEKTIDGLLRVLQLKDRNGIYVAKVEPNSPAAKAGLEKGDVVIEFMGKAVKNQFDLFSGVAQADPGMKVEFKYIRDGKKQSSTAELTERPAK